MPFHPVCICLRSRNDGEMLGAGLGQMLPVWACLNLHKALNASETALMCRFHQRRGGLQYGASGSLGEYEF